ncbi:hypothetical protein V6U90_33460 [Micromonospora sp. CPCC 206060]|uniref:hypothetical protein n=1 Tax=Micromonospora sp. CPCC 206060 TaxID=3122406 RepID=UPI002FF3F21E
MTAGSVLSNAPTPWYPRWRAEWAFNSGILAVAFAAYMVGLIAPLLTAGTVADRYGRKVVLVPGLGGAVIACRTGFWAIRWGRSPAARSPRRLCGARLDRQ